MPLILYGRDGRHAEREELFLSYKDVPDTIEVDGVTMVKVPARSRVFFKGAFSGGTGYVNGMYHDKELATIPEVRKYAKERKKEKERVAEQRMDNHIESHLSQFDI